MEDEEKTKKQRHLDKINPSKEVKTLQVEVWVGKDGKVETVNEAGHLGTKVMPKLNDLEPRVFECIGVYDRPNGKVRATFTLESLGEIKTRPTYGESVHKTMKDVKFNALKWLFEPEILTALTDAEKVRLQNIGVIELNGILLTALEGKTLEGKPLPKVWTPLDSAAQAIMRHDNGMEADAAFPKLIVTIEPDIIDVPDHADGAKATLAVGTHMFTVGDKYFRFVGYLVCKGRPRYAFTWMDVPVAFLDEPK